MNKYFFVACISFTSLCGSAQIRGTVEDDLQEGISYANVLLYQLTDSSFLTGVYSDENGQFLINYQIHGEYYLQIGRMGYKTLAYMPVNLPEAGQIDLGTITLETESTLLDEVLITGKKDLIQQTAFGKVVNVQNSLLTKGSNALQMLERLPGVITDKQNNELSLNGQAGVAVLINGRRVMMNPAEIMDLLENTLADNIEKVELITSPSSRYDADGSAGLINIIMHQHTAEKNRFGFTAMGGFGYGEKGAVSLNYQKTGEKLSFTSSYGYVRDVRRSGFAGMGTSTKPAILGGHGTDVFSTFVKAHQNGHTLNLTTEYRPQLGLTLGTDWMLSFAQDHNFSHANVSWDTEEFGYLAMKANSDGESLRANLIGSLFLDKEWENSRISLDLSMLSYSNDNPSTIGLDYFDEIGEPLSPPSDIFTTGNRGQSLSRIQVGIAKVDFERSFGSSISGEFGGKISFSDNKNDSGIESLINGTWQSDPRSQSLIFGKEKVLAAYSQFRFTLGQNSSLHTGLRYEYWQRDINTEGEPFRISGLFPTILFTKDFKEGHSVNLGYFRRITRPLYTDLVSNLFYNDPTFIFSGNPSLKPTLADQIKLDVNIPRFSSSLIYQYEKTPILRHQITTNAEQNIGISSPQNLDFSRSLTLFINSPFQLTNWWNLSISSTTSLRNYQISYTPEVAAKTYLFQSVNVSQNFTLPGGMELEVSGWQNLRSYNGSNRTAGFGVVNLGLSKKLKEDKGTLTLSLPDVFRTFKVHTHIGGMTRLIFDIDVVSDWWDETALYQVFRLSYSKTFGGQVARKNRNREEELKRVEN